MASKTFHRGVRDLVFAAWSAENTWGTDYPALGAREATVEFVVESDELRGDDVVLDRFTKIVAVTLRVSMASVDLDVLDLLLGGTLVSNSSYEDFKFTEDDDTPYVGIAARVMGSDAAHDLHMLIPKAKVSGNLNFSAQVDTYLIPGAEFQGVNEGSTNGMIRLRKFTAATAVEIPLRTSTGGFS
jgi:hypothetical protein